jgi:hypothetical protein
MAPAHHARARPTPQDHQPTGEPDEPLTHDHNRETKPLTLGPIGWSYRRETTMGTSGSMTNFSDWSNLSLLLSVRLATKRRPRSARLGAG